MKDNLIFLSKWTMVSSIISTSIVLIFYAIRQIWGIQTFLDFVNFIIPATISILATELILTKRK